MPPLTDKAIRAAKPGAKPRKLVDDRDLFLLITPAGANLWRFRFRFGGRDTMVSFGSFPDTSLALAREKLDDARRLLARGINPAEERKAEKAAEDAAADSFEVIAREWLAREEPGWAPGHTKRVKQRLENDVFPFIGTIPVSTVTPTAVLDVIQRVEARKSIETGHLILWSIGAIMRLAVATGRAPSDPKPSLRGALPPSRREHFAAITNPTAFGELLRAIEGFYGTPTVKAALWLAPWLFVRPGELRRMEWAELDLDPADGGLWAIPGAKMKGGVDHMVPLAKQCVSVLGDKALRRRRSDFVFPNLRTAKRPMSEVAVLAGLRRLGYDGDTVSGHGFRATARTLLDEALGFPPHLVEYQLAHSVRDPLGRAYNRTTHLPERRDDAEVGGLFRRAAGHEAGRVIGSRSRASVRLRIGQGYSLDAVIGFVLG